MIVGCLLKGAYVMRLETVFISGWFTVIGIKLGLETVVLMAPTFCSLLYGIVKYCS